jgi:glycopeptide antibiotics resistance protein
VTVRVLAAVGLAAWLVVALLLTVQPVQPPPGQVIDDNFVLFRTFGIYFANLDSPFWVGQLVGNLLLFLPFGFLGPMAFGWLDGWIRIFVGALVLSLLVEAAQLWVPNRSADVDDVILNVAGALLGYGLYRVLRLGSRSRDAVTELR